MLAFLPRVRLAPNPFPVGCGSSRVESYTTGVPVVSMRVQFNPANWNRRQLLVSEVTERHAPLGTTTSVEGYAEFCRRCLYDERYAERLVDEQLEVVKRLTDPDGWWRQLFGDHERWLESTETQDHDLFAAAVDELA